MNNDPILPGQGSLVVCKERTTGNDRGFLIPLFRIDNTANIKQITVIKPQDYPRNIEITKGYSQIDATYSDNEIFIINEHRPKSEDNELQEFWALGSYAAPLPVNVLMPILECSLPPKETAELPVHVTAPKGTFFIRNEGLVFGPFTATKSDTGAFVLEPKVTSILPFGKDVTGQFNQEEMDAFIVKVNLLGQQMHFVTSLHDIQPLRKVELDYITDDKLIKQFSAMKFGSEKLSKRDGERLANSMQEFERHRRIATSEVERVQRFKTLLDRYIEETSVGTAAIRQFFNSSTGKSFLNDYVERNRATLLSSTTEEMNREVQRQQNQARSEITKLQAQAEAMRREVDQQRQKAQTEIEQISLEKNEQIRERLRKEEEALSEQVAQKQAELESIQNRILEITDRLKLANEVNELENQRTYLTRRNQELEDTKSNLEIAIKAFESRIRDRNSMASSMGEMEAVSRALRGGNVLVQDERIWTPVSFTENPPSDGLELIDRIRNHLDNTSGRSFTHSEMTNIMVSLTQSFLTVLAGAPGVGKTSTVVRLAEALHLGGTNGISNFLYLPVSRGWVSGRDLLGFFNPLNGLYQRARTGLYDFLKNAQSIEEDSLRFILLDEANLSPLEHYWSDFIGMCDPEGRSRPIDTGHPDSQKRQMVVPDSVRFIATINRDSTTERLSPRLIDRAPIISLEHDWTEGAPPETELTLDGAINYTLCTQLLMNNNSEDMPRSQKQILENILNVMTRRDASLGQPIAISHRKTSAINNYCVVAGRLMDDYELAFDYAVSQHILPHIEGHGPKFKARLEDLQAVLKENKFYNSQQHLSRILESGSNFAGTYSFF